MRLILIRHGQTVCNITDIWHGWDQCELTELGLSQASALANRLAHEPIAAIHSSDLRRAMQTAEIVGRPHGLTPVPDADFRERSAGDFQGLTTREVEGLHPTVWDERARDYWGWSPPGGETFRQLLDRCVAGLSRLRQQYPDQTTAIVGHMGTVRVLTSHLLNIPMDDTYEMDFPSTGVTIIRIEGGNATAEVLNDGSHLLDSLPIAGTS